MIAAAAAAATKASSLSGLPQKLTMIEANITAFHEGLTRIVRTKSTAPRTKQTPSKRIMMLENRPSETHHSVIETPPMQYIVFTASSSNNGSRNRNGGEATNPVFAGGVHAGDPAKASRGSDGSSSGVLNRSGIEFNGSNSFGRGPRAYAEMNRVNMEAGATAPPSITTVAKR